MNASVHSSGPPPQYWAQASGAGAAASGIQHDSCIQCRVHADTNLYLLIHKKKLFDFLVGLCIRETQNYETDCFTYSSI